MNPELEALMASLRAGGQAKVRQSGLDEDYARAEKLSNTSSTRTDKWGQTSPLALIGDLMGQNRGRGQMRALKPQREAAGQAVAEASTALPMYRAGVAADKVTQDQENFTQTETGKTKRSLALATAKLAAAETASTRADEKRKTKNVVRPGTNKTEVVEVGPKGVYYQGGVPVENQKDWIDAPTKTQEVTGAGGYGGKNDDKESRAYNNTIGNVDRVYGLLADVTPEQEDMLNSTSYRAKMALVETLTPEKFASLTKSEFAGYDPATRKMMIALHSMSSEERHRLFGSALTKPEIMSSQDFLANTIGKGVGFVRDALQDTKQKNVDMLLGVDEQYGSTKYKDMLVNNGTIPADYERTTFELGAEPATGSAVSSLVYDDPEKEALFQAYKAGL